MLSVDRPGVHSADDFHDRNTGLRVAVQDGGFDRSGATILWEEGRVDIEDAEGFEEAEDFLGDDVAKRGKDTNGVGVLFDEGWDGGKLFSSGDGSDNFVSGTFERVGNGSDVRFDALDELLVAEENDLTHRGRGSCCPRFPCRSRADQVLLGR